MEQLICLTHLGFQTESERGMCGGREKECEKEQKERKTERTRENEITISF